MTYSEATEELIATLKVMRMQEETGYNCDSHSYRQSFFRLSAPVDESCRAKMIEWSYQVTDFCKFNRETVAVATNYLDRFMQVDAPSDRKTFQLASMTCLYTAIKIHEPKAMEPKTVANLSRGTYTEDEVTDMERRILKALQWRMNPPTALAFVRQYLSLLPEGLLSDSDMASIAELTTFQTELAVSDSWFIGTKPSTTALAALMNALHFSELPMVQIDAITTLIKHHAEIICTTDYLLDVEDRLYSALESSSITAINVRASPKLVSKPTSRSSGVGSPRSVSTSH